MKQNYISWVCSCSLSYSACNVISHITICGIAVSTSFLHICSKMADFQKMFVEHIMGCLIALRGLSDICLLVRKLHCDIIIVHKSSCNVSIILCQSLAKLEIFYHFFENYSNKNFIICVQRQPAYSSLSERVVDRETKRS